MNSNNYVCEINLIDNKINQSFTYMIDLSLYNTLKYGDLVLVKFNNRFNIGLVLNVQEIKEEFSYKLNPVLDVLKDNNLSDSTKDLSEYIAKISFNKSSDIINLINSKNEVSKPKLEVYLIEDIDLVKNAIEGYFKEQKVSAAKVYSELDTLLCFLEYDDILDGFLYKKVKKEHMKLLDYLYVNKYIGFRLYSPKVKQVKGYSLDKKEYYDKQAFMKINDLSEYKLNKLRKSGDVFVDDLSQDKLLTYFDHKSLEQVKLTEYQNEKLLEIKDVIKDKPVLLHGITGSGKTAIYAKLIEEYINCEKTVLFLVPEITLIKQVVKELKKCFGDSLDFYYGDMTPSQKNNFLSALKNGKTKIVIGTRSSVFLEIPDLGLVVVDEEHDSSYKQNFYPYYSVNDFADFWTSKDIDVLMASATPSILSYAKAQKGVYNLVTMNKRYNDYSNALIKFKEYDSDNIISKDLIDYLKSSLDNGEKVLIFFNIKGYSKILECDECKDIPTCPNCNISLKYYKNNATLECSYCDFKVKNYTTCNKCGSNTLNYVGMGIEMVEEELNKYFKGNVLRIDSKVSKTKVKVNKIIEDFNDSSSKILLGTQIIAKGLNFDSLNKVVILNLDNMLYFNDFSAYEQTYQLLEQVSGRSGRDEETGEVLIYTNHRDNYVFKSVKNHSYEEFFKEEMINRKLQRTSPYYYVCQIEVRHKSEERCKSVLEYLKKELDSNFLVTELVRPYIVKIDDKYRLKIYVKYKQEDIKGSISSALTKGGFEQENILIDLRVNSYGY